MDSSYQDEFDEDDDSRLPILFNQRVHKEQIKGISDLKLNWKVITPKVRCVLFNRNCNCDFRSQMILLWRCFMSSKIAHYSFY